MKKLLFVFILICIQALIVLAAPNTTSTTPGTMRVDYFHTGNAGQELMSLDRVVIEPLPWAGNANHPIDDSNLGKYIFEVIDRNTNRITYSRGFCSIYGEWETTDEAKKLNRTFHESLRFPAPTSSVQIVLKKRNPADNTFREIWSLIVDPNDMFVDRAKPEAPGKLIEIMKNGDPANKVDLLILGDGYTAAEMKKFEADARRLSDLMFNTSPYKERKNDFNVWALCPASPESGISRPSTGIHRTTPLGTSYDAFGSERYVLTFDNRAFRTIASFAPYDSVEILVNSRTYGGGGIFGLYGTVSSDNASAPYIFIHEFGHHFAGLADEYYTSATAYAPSTERLEPWEPNVTALLDPKNVKWGDMIQKDTPVPTPWSKEEYDKYSAEFQKRRGQIRKENRPETEMEALFAEVLNRESKQFATEPYADRVGAFEGANYESKGYFRSQLNCIMFTRKMQFCQVCKHTIERVIDLYTR